MVTKPKSKPRRVAKKKVAAPKKVTNTRVIVGRGSNHTMSDAGVRLDAKSVMSYAPIYYAVSRISGHVGISHLELRKRTAGRKSRPATPGELEVDSLINERPNGLQTAVVLREHMQSAAIYAGNGRAAILRNADQEPVQLIPLIPERVQTVLIWRENKTDSVVMPEKWHLVSTGAGRPIEIPDRDVVHIQGLGGDGIVGWSLMELAANSIGGGLAAERHVNRTYRNNAVPGIVLEAPEGVYEDDDDARDFIESFNRSHSGLDQSNSVGLLRFGVKASPISMSGRDSQFVEQRRLAREEAALWTLIESMLGIDSSTSYNSLQQKNQAYLQNCLARWLVKWEAECRQKLLSPLQRDQGYFWKFDTSAILRGSLKERVDAYQVSRVIGLLSQEEIREAEDLPEIDRTHNFTNPNTTADTPAPEAPEPASEPPEGPEGRLGARLRDVVRSQVERFIETERHRLCDLSAKDTRFAERAADFYNGFGPRLCGLVRSLGGTGDMGDSYIGESQALLAAVLQGRGDLQAKIDKETKSWAATRGRDLADRIVSGDFSR